jgi:uncharacterized Tic20 family protein
VGVPNEQPRDEERTLAGIAHLLILASIYGVLIYLVIWRRERSRSRYVAFQAAQAMLYQFAVYILGVVPAFAAITVIWLPYIWFGPPLPDVSPEGEVFGPARIFGVVFLLVASFTATAFLLLVSFGAIAYAIYGAMQCFQRRPFRYLVVAALGERLVPAAPPSGEAEPAAP